MTPFFHGRIEYRNPNLIYKLEKDPDTGLDEFEEMLKC
jgi:hypothetical protein